MDSPGADPAVRRLVWICMRCPLSCMGSMEEGRCLPLRSTSMTRPLLELCGCPVPRPRRRLSTWPFASTPSDEGVLRLACVTSTTLSGGMSRASGGSTPRRRALPDVSRRPPPSGTSCAKKLNDAWWHEIDEGAIGSGGPQRTEFRRSTHSLDETDEITDMFADLYPDVAVPGCVWVGL